MADYSLDSGGGDYTRPRATQETPYQAPSVPTSQTPTQVWEQPSTPEPPAPTGYTPPPNAGSWNGYYHQPGTTQPQGYQPPAPYQMGADFRYGQGGQANTQLGQYGNRLEGFDSGKLNDPTRDSAKYMFGRLASKYAPTQQGYQQLMQDPEFQRLGMQSIGNGNIRLPNGDVIDVVRGFQGGGGAWQWGARTVNGQSTEAPQAPQTPAMDPWTQMQQQYAQQQQAYAQQQSQQQAWQQYQQQQQLQQQQAWQQYMMSQPQPTQQADPAAPAYPDPSQTAYYHPTPQVQASPSYGGSGSYNSGVGLQSGGGAPPAGAGYPQAFNYLAQGMPSPYFYG